MTDSEILERAMAGECRMDGSTFRVLADEVRRLRDSLAACNRNYISVAAERDRAAAERDALMGVVVRPWTREGDGAKLWRVYLAWFDSTETEAEAVAMVRRAAGLEPATEATS